MKEIHSFDYIIGYPKKRGVLRVHANGCWKFKRQINHKAVSCWWGDKGFLTLFLCSSFIKISRSIALSLTQAQAATHTRVRARTNHGRTDKHTRAWTHTHTHTYTRTCAPNNPGTHGFWEVLRINRKVYYISSFFPAFSLYFNWNPYISLHKTWQCNKFLMVMDGGTHGWMSIEILIKGNL